jgi:uncharacterized protein (TIGR03546 family)
MQLSLAFFYGALLGLTPTLAVLHCLIILLSFVFLRVPLILTALTAVIAFGLGLLVLDPLLDKIGQSLLTMASLQGLWTQIYNAPLLPLLKLNNSLVLGALVVSLALLPLCVLLGYRLASIHNSAGKGA